MHPAMTTSVFRIKPPGFSPSLEIAACYIESNGKWLFLKRSEGKSEEGKWGVPAGKIEPSETPLEAAIRETREETAIFQKEPPTFIGKIFVRKPGIDYVYHMYHQTYSQFPAVTLNDEHQEFRWLTAGDIFQLPLMEGGVMAWHHFRALANKPQLIRKPFYFIRHGETDVNANPLIKRVDYDLPLNKNGRNQAQLAKASIIDLPLKSVCYSPIQRAVETKDILAEDLATEQVEIKQLSECQAAIWMKMVRLEKGLGYHVCEEIEHFLCRAVSGLASALDKAGPTLIVAHGGIHWAFCYHMGIENHPWKIGNCQLVHFSPKGDQDWEANLVPMLST
ncbi:MAG: histidine phosphatase family protein [Chlamydiales bacterium]|nr:histidine phosphatase family protein [Chlamydiales bacterium]